MKTVLVVFFLSVQSSYSGNTEIAATEDAFDTVQFYAANGTSWRIKTYAQDQDVHIWSLGSKVADLVALARTNTEKHYGDVLTEGYIIETEERSEEHTSELQSLMRISYAVFCLKKKKKPNHKTNSYTITRQTTTIKS